MLTVAIFLINEIASIVLFGIAGALALRQAPGWGWFLFVGVLCAGTGAVRAKTKKGDDKP